MEQAVDFSLDVQEQAAAGTLNPESFKGLIEKYGANKVNATTLVFPDNSAAIWREDEQSWEIQKVYQSN